MGHFWFFPHNLDIYRQNYKIFWNCILLDCPPLSVIFCKLFTSKMGPLRFLKMRQNLGAEQTAWGKMGQSGGLNGREHKYFKIIYYKNM